MIDRLRIESGRTLTRGCLALIVLLLVGCESMPRVEGCDGGADCPPAGAVTVWLVG